MTEFKMNVPSLCTSACGWGTILMRLSSGFIMTRTLFIGVFAVSPEISGSISIEGDTANTPMNNVRVIMNPLESRIRMVPQPQAEVQSDGTFILNSVMPGRWQIYLNGVPGYVKSVQQGDRDVSPWDFETGPSAVQLKIVVGARYARVDVLLAGAAGSEPISAMLWPAGGDPRFQQNRSEERRVGKEC